MAELIKCYAMAACLKRLGKGALTALFLVCFIPLSIIFLVLVFGAGMVFAMLLVLVLEAELLLAPDAADGPNGIRAVLLSFVEEECGHEPPASDARSRIENS
jgi:hypothetical protein